MMGAPFITWFRGLALLRYPSLVTDLGERRFHLDVVAKLRARFPQSKLSTDLRLSGDPESWLRLGAGATIEAGTLLAFGDRENGFGQIDIGANTWVGQYNNLRASGDAKITIGSNCLISQFCTLVGSNHSHARGHLIQAQGPESLRRGVTIGNDVWLGAGVTLTPGVTVHDGAIVGAGAVVTRNIPPYEIWGGVPAHKLGERE